MPSITDEILKNVKSDLSSGLPSEDIISNLQGALKAMARENSRLEEEVRAARSDNADLKEAIAAVLVERYAYGERGMKS